MSYLASSKLVANEWRIVCGPTRFVMPAARAACVEATEFMELSRRYRVSGVPKTIVNGKVEILGALPEDAFVRQVLSLEA